MPKAEVVEILNEIGTEILNTMYSNGYVEDINRTTKEDNIIAAGTLLEELTLEDLEP